jgi:hypothetical protein
MMVVGVRGVCVFDPSEKSDAMVWKIFIGDFNFEITA